MNLGRLQVKDAGVEDRVRVQDRLKVPVICQRARRSHRLHSPSHANAMNKACPGPGSAGAGLQHLHRDNETPRTILEPVVDFIAMNCGSAVKQHALL